MAAIRVFNLPDLGWFKYAEGIKDEDVMVSVDENGGVYIDIAGKLAVKVIHEGLKKILLDDIKSGEYGEVAETVVGWPL